VKIDENNIGKAGMTQTAHVGANASVKRKICGVERTLAAYFLSVPSSVTSYTVANVPLWIQISIFCEFGSRKRKTVTGETPYWPRTLPTEKAVSKSRLTA
jgi:hypothetical protein